MRHSNTVLLCRYSEKQASISQMSVCLREVQRDKTNLPVRNSRVILGIPQMPTNKEKSQTCISQMQARSPESQRHIPELRMSTVEGGEDISIGSEKIFSHLANSPDYSIYRAKIKPGIRVETRKERRRRSRPNIEVRSAL